MAKFGYHLIFFCDQLQIFGDQKCNVWPLNNNWNHLFKNRFSIRHDKVEVCYKYMINDWICLSLIFATYFSFNGTLSYTTLG